MGKSTAERQREWKARRRAEGKKPISVMLTEEARRILIEETGRTGEKYPEVIERAILNLRIKTVCTDPPDDQVTINHKTLETPVDQTRESTSDSVTGNVENFRDQILGRIFEMKDDADLSFGEIARRLNAEGIETFSGKGKWHGKTISKMYWKRKKA